MREREASRDSRFWTLRQKIVWFVPFVLVVAYTKPLLTFQLPNYESVIGEEYQPIKTLKFLKTRGEAYEKWAPVENFVLAPGYLVTLGYWVARGTLRNPVATFPYGFQDPINQLSLLILQGRIVYLAFACLCLWCLARALTRLGHHPAAVSLAMLFCVATNPVILKHFVILKPDGPMLALSSVALGVYAVILSKGWNVRRGAAFGLFVSLAFGTKEIAGPIFVLPVLALATVGIHQGRDARSEVRYGIAAAICTALVSYFVSNVWYAPHTWLERMRFCFGVGSGAQAAIWAPPGQSLLAYTQSLACETLANLGPGGMPVVLIAIVALVAVGTWRERALALPVVSFMLFGLAATRYAPDYFLMPLALAATLPTCWGFQRLISMARHPLRDALLGVVAIAAVINLAYANLAWIDLGANVPWLVERHAVANVRKGSPIWIASFWSRVPGRSRLDWLGYHLDERSAAELAQKRVDMPDVLYVDPAMQHWLDQVPKSPARVQMLKASANFSLDEWPGFEGLGYERREWIKPVIPWWWPFGWLPRGESNNREGVVVYSRHTAGSIADFVPPSP